MILRYWKTNLVLVTIIIILVRLINSGSIHQSDNMHAITEPRTHYMHHMNSTIMDQYGTIKNILKAKHMVHYLDKTRTEFIEPELETFFADQSSMLITSDKSWFTQAQQTLLLQGNVHLVQFNDEAISEWEMTTDKVSVFTDSKQIETDTEVTLSNAAMRTKGARMQAYLDDRKIQLFDHVQTQTLP